MPGRLYGVGIGPGDPELITLKAKRIIESVRYIAVPKANTDGESVALSIVKEYIPDEVEILELVFPMSHDEKLLYSYWNEAASSISSKLDGGHDVAFITLGDPSVYSTYMYIHRLLGNKGYDAEVIPGITSFCASAAKAGVSLAENSETIAIIPSAYECDKLDMILDSFDNIVMMKVAKNLAEINGKLLGKGLADKALLVSRCGFDDQMIEFDLDKAAQSKLSYFTTLIIKKNGVK